jgi:hypothetical protein
MSDDKPPAHRIRAKANMRALLQGHAALASGLKEHIEDIKNVSKSAVSGRYSANEWVADVTALWINGASLVARAVLSGPLAMARVDLTGDPVQREPEKVPNSSKPPAKQ